MAPPPICLWRRCRRSWRIGKNSRVAVVYRIGAATPPERGGKTRDSPFRVVFTSEHGSRLMQEHLKKRDQIRAITRELLDTYGKLQPKLEHLAPAPLPDKASVIQILEDFLAVIYPRYFGRKYVETSNVEYHIGDLIDSIYARLTVEIYRSVRPECDRTPDFCSHCHDRGEDEALTLLGKLPRLRTQLSIDVQAAYDGDPAAKSIDEVIFAYPAIMAITI